MENTSGFKINNEIEVRSKHIKALISERWIMSTKYIKLNEQLNALHEEKQPYESSFNDEDKACSSEFVDQINSLIGRINIETVSINKLDDLISNIDKEITSACDELKELRLLHGLPYAPLFAKYIPLEPTGGVQTH